jgi:hypothetical protein
MPLTYSLFQKAILDSSGLAERITEVLRYRTINIVLAVWNPGHEIDDSDLETYFGFKMSERLKEYADRIKSTLKTVEATSPQCMADLFYFSEIARSIEDARSEHRKTQGDYQAA